jgi:triphosphoribosyl-dephospho-CoA synthase
MNHLQLADAYKAACMAELQALKPGNVHVFADGHGMTVQDFILSAEAASVVIAQPDLSLGQRILQSVQATHDAVKMNTNLGMILLCAPMLQAALKCNIHAGHATLDDFKQSLKAVLNSTTIEDADDAFAAIRLANPAGLGQVAQHDVNQAAACTLLQAMQVAAARDLIALQYCNNFADVLDVGLSCYQAAMQRWQNPAWAATAVHLHFMANFLDSHIVRKYNETIAKMVQAEAAAHELEFLKAYNPKNYQMPLLRFDAELKKRGLNPGTSADMTVATLFAAQLIQV